MSTKKRVGRNAEEQALFDYQDAGNAFVDGGAAKYVQGEGLNWEDLDPETLAMLEESGLNDINVDPQYKNAQLDALRSLEEQSKNGLTARDAADMAKLQSDVGRTNRGRIGAIQQNMAARGLGGSGMELVAQMQAAQDAADREAMAALEQGAIAGERRNQATNQRATLAGQMGDREYNQKAAAAQANDVIARFNVTNRVNAQNTNNAGQNAANQANWQRGNQTSDNNVNAGYDHRQATLGVQQGNAQMANAYSTEMYNRDQAKKAAAAAKKKGQMGAVLGTAGAIAGGVLGSAAGPAGTVVGAQMGSSIGSSVGQSFANGGKIYGPEVYPGDHPANDQVPIWTSGGERVLPKSVADDPIKAAQFVAQDKAKEKSSIDPMILNYLAKSNPDLVAQYKERNGVAEKGKADAENLQMMGGLGNVAGNLANDYANSQRVDAIYNNDWMKGTGPIKIDRAERTKYDGSAIDKVTSQNMSAADAKLNAIKEQMKQDYAVNRDMNKEALDANQVRKGDERYDAEQALRAKTREEDVGFRNKQLEGQQADRSEARAMRIALSGQAKEDKQAALDEKRRYEEGIKAKDASTKANAGMHEVEDRRTNIKQSLGILQKMVKEDGTYEMLGSHNQDLDRLVDQIATDMAKLSDPTSVARPSEVEQVKANLIKSGFQNTNGTALDLLKNFEKEVDLRAETAYKVRGLTSPNAKKPAAGPVDYDSMSDEELEALLKGK